MSRLHPTTATSRPTRFKMAELLRASHQACATALACALLAACAPLPVVAPGNAAAPAQVAAASASTTTVASSAPPSTPASAPTSVAPGSAASAPASAASAPRPGEPPPPRPFAEVIRDAKEIKGFFPVWRKDDRVWLEIAEEQFQTPFFLDVNISNAVGERGLYASEMGDAWLVELKKIGTNVQLLARNTGFRADGDKAMAATVAQSFSPSLLAATPIVSAPHPTRKTVLVDAAFLLADLPNYSRAAEAAFRIVYNLDKPNSSFVNVSADEVHAVLSTQMHFSTARIALPPTTPPPPGTPVPTPPKTTPEARSFFVGFVYTLSKLPDTPMATRPSDPRLGHFATSYTDLTNDLKPKSRVHLINRWRLEKKDPSAALSEPKKPIVYWVDKNVPERYRTSVQEGILEWNKAFEAIGFKGAIEARLQPGDASWDNMDGKHASIRWFTGADVGFARGPSRTDPRTGEVLDADIAMSDVFGLGARRFISDDVGRDAFSGGDAASQERLSQVMTSLRSHRGHDHFYGSCDYAAASHNEAQFAMDILEARGDIAPDSPEAEAFVQAYIKATIMHEVGHTLGLKHNFKASTTVSREALRKPGPIASSVMDYDAFNIPLKGEPRGSYNQSTIGPYDYWAIAYAYSEFAPGTDAPELAKIAARSTEPQLAYGDDADAGGFGPNEGLDPLINRFDQGDDPLAFYGRRLKLSRELWDRIQERKPEPGDDPLRSRRSLAAGFNQVALAADLVTKYLGGMHVLRDLPGTTGRKTYTPVDPAKQREALAFLSNGLFAVDSFKFKPEFLASVGTDFNEWDRGQPFSVRNRVSGIQVQALDRLLGAGVASRLLNLPNYIAANQRKAAINLNEVYTTVQNAIWQELASGKEADALRRNLQRAHLARLTSAITRPGGLPPDALSLLRLHARKLQANLQRANSASASLSIETQAHYADSLGQITEALKATMSRS